MFGVLRTSSATHFVLILRPLMCGVSHILADPSQIPISVSIMSKHKTDSQQHHLFLSSVHSAKSYVSFSFVMAGENTHNVHGTYNTISQPRNDVKQKPPERAVISLTWGNGEKMAELVNVIILQKGRERWGDGLVAKTFALKG